MANIFMNSKFQSKYYDKNIRHMGCDSNSFYQRNRPYQRNIECYIKVFFLILDFFFSLSNKGKDFFISTSTIYKVLTKKEVKDKDGNIKYTGYGNNYSYKTVQRAIAILNALNLITIVYNPVKKSDMINPNEYWNRKIYPNMDVIKELLNIYSEEDPFINSYAKALANKFEIEKYSNTKTVYKKRSKSLEGKLEYTDMTRDDLFHLFKTQLLKIIRKRPYSYIEQIEAKFNEYKEKGINQGYNNAEEMFLYHSYKITSKYVYVKTFKKYIPNHLINKQAKIDSSFRNDAILKGELNDEDIVRIKTMSLPDAKNLIEHLKGFVIPNRFLKIVKDLHILYVIKDGKYYITKLDEEAIEWNGGWKKICSTDSIYLKTDINDGWNNI